VQIHSAGWQSAAAMLAAWRGPHWTISDDEAKLLAQASIPLSKMGTTVELPDWLQPIVELVGQLLAPLALVGGLILAARIVAQPRLEYEAARRAAQTAAAQPGAHNPGQRGNLRPVASAPRAPVNGQATPDAIGLVGLELGDA
jgi:hypothetical protein